MGKVDKVGPKACNRDFTVGGVLKALRKLCGGFSVTTCELPQVTNSGLGGGSNTLAPIICSAG
jgi:hypothetical protein